MIPVRSARPSRRAFTLVEILVVVVVLGVLAAIVIPSFASASQEAMQTAFAVEIRQYTDAAYVYQAKTGYFLEDSSSGAVPAGFEDYIDTAKWLDGTPVGGVWDCEFESFGVTSALGVHFNGTGATRDDAFMLGIDAIFDDADLDTGGFRKIAGDRYYTVLVD